MPNKNKPRFDWESIEKEYRAGQLSIREIARQHGCSAPAITRKAKRLGWKRDLTAKIQQAVNTKLVNNNVNTNLNEKEIIEQAADRAIKVVEIQRESIQKAKRLCDTLFVELEEQKTESVVVGKGGDSHVEEIDIPAIKKASPFYSLTGALKNLIVLERQAYNIDAKGPSGSEDDPIHIAHSMNTKGLQKAMAPKPVNPTMIEEGG